MQQRPNQVEEVSLETLQHSSTPLALIAGNGRLPGHLLEQAYRHGIAVMVLAIRHEASQELVQMAKQLHWISPGRLGQIIGLCQQHNVRHLMMLGGIRKSRLFSPFAIDWTGLRLLWQLPWRSDDTLLRAVAREFAKHHMQLLSPSVLLPNFMTPAGPLTSHVPVGQTWHDLRQGFQIAQQIGQLDIGQTLIVHRGVVVAVEALEGTNACIMRAGSMLRHQGGVMIKVAKPQQDMRLDIPTVGVETIACLAKANIHTLGLEAHRTMIVDPEAFRSAAEQHGIAVIGLQGDAQPISASQATASG